jgi:hypothetical protein
VLLLAPASLTRIPRLSCFINQEPLFLLSLNVNCSLFSRLPCQAGYSDKLTPRRFLIMPASTRVFCISLPLSKKIRQESHHHPYQCARVGSITEYHLQLLVLRLPNLKISYAT